MTRRACLARLGLCLTGCSALAASGCSDGDPVVVKGNSGAKRGLKNAEENELEASRKRRKRR